MARRRVNVGRVESQILRYVLDHHPVTGGEVAAHFTNVSGLARTTVLTMIDRLARKGFLTRKKVGPAYQYSPEATREQILKDLVGDFVEVTLGGSVSPFVAYLAGSTSLTDAELAELKRLVDELEVRRNEGRS
jgi:predicted transcriptional regulator